MVRLKELKRKIMIPESNEERISMNRRDILKTMVVAGIAVPISILTSQVVQVDSVSDALRGYTLELRDGDWNIYVKKWLNNELLILHPKTFKVCRPLQPIFVERRIGVQENGTIKEFPTVIVKNQRVFCCDTGDISQRFLVVT